MKKLIPKHCTHPICHCADGVDTIDCWAFLNERFKECPHTKCECYKKNKRMKKIMFNDKYCLTQAVLEGTKTMTRRKFTLTLDKGVDGKLIRVYPSKVFFDNGKWLFDYDGRIYNLPKENYPRYGVGEVVAIAQSYKELYSPDDVRVKFNPFFDMTESAGWNNKLFVESQYMKHHIRITDVKVERLRDISEEDVLREGVRYYLASDKRWYNDSGYGYHIPKNGLHLFDTPYKAFANLFERISGKGTWESNPFVVAYSFELVD